uniref:Uncharacterized protein n=1 Tax=Octopus bimaculoides TaxID=37653 RepID=A0A0L8HBI9_OCTBM
MEEIFCTTKARNCSPQYEGNISCSNKQQQLVIKRRQYFVLQQTAIVHHNMKAIFRAPTDSNCSP